MMKMMKKLTSIAVIVVVLLLSSSAPVLAATAPAITANAATYVAQTTAQLNAIVNDDGSEDCDVRWGWDTETRAVFTDYTNISDWSDTEWNTDEHPYHEIDSLNDDDEHFWAVQIRNSHSTVKSSELSFTTEASVAVPANLLALPTPTSVALIWIKGVGSTLTIVRYSESSYPTTVTDGTSAYVGVLSNCIIEDLSSGHTYYISAWGRSGATDSGTYATVMTSTTAGAPEGAEPDELSEPAMWFQVPNYAVLANIPLYNEWNTFFASIDLPTTTGWLILTLLACMGSGVVVFFIAGRKPTPALVVLAVSFGIASNIELLPMYMMAFTIIFILGAWKLREAG